MIFGPFSRTPEPLFFWQQYRALARFYHVKLFPFLNFLGTFSASIFVLIFGSILDDFLIILDTLWTPNVAKNRSKIDVKHDIDKNS